MTNYDHYDFSLVFYCIHATAFNDGYTGKWIYPRDGSISRCRRLKGAALLEHIESGLDHSWIEEALESDGLNKYLLDPSRVGGFHSCISKFV